MIGQNAAMLIASRAGQGLGGFAATLGVVLSGLLTQYASWARSPFIAVRG